MDVQELAQRLAIFGLTLRMVMWIGAYALFMVVSIHFAWKYW